MSLVSLGLGAALVSGASTGQASARPTYFGLAGQIGSFGSNDGQFQDITGAATDSDGNVYVADSRLLRIQKFSPTGRLVLKWGNPTPTGSLSPGQLESTGDVAIDRAGGFVYVSDGAGNRVQKFTLGGQLLARWGRSDGDGSAGTGPGEFTHPGALTVDSAGVLYVVDRLPQSPQRRVQRLRSDGMVLGQFTGPPFWALTADSDGNLYATYGGPEVRKMNSIGQPLATWGKMGTRLGELGSAPSGVAFDKSSGTLWLADAANYRLQQFTTAGRFLRACGEYDISRGLTVAPNGDVYAGGSYYLRHFGTVSGPARPCDQLAPSITSLTIAPPRLALPPARGSGGATLLLRYRLSEDAQVRLFVDRSERGRKVGLRCLPASARQSSPRCTRWLQQLDRTARGRTGSNSTRVSPRQRGRWWPAGVYRVRVVATDDARNASRSHSVRFTLLER